MAHAFRLRREDRLTFIQLAALADEVRILFDDKNIRIQPLSTLGSLLTHVDTVASQWKNGIGQDCTAMVDATTAMRIIAAVLAARNDANAHVCYRRITKKDVNLFSPEPSQGKDALWELELLQILSKRGLRASLSEPDIVVTIGSLRIPIACKKIYSERNLEHQLRSAGWQLARLNLGGIVALNIDAQLPEKNIIVCRTLNEASKILVEVVHNFLAKHQVLIRRLIRAGKFDAVHVTASCPVDSRRVRPRFNVCTESLLWCPPDVCTAEGLARVEALRSGLNLKNFYD